MAKDTYTPSGQVAPTGGGDLSTALQAFNMGGTRVVALATALLQINALQDNLSLAQSYYNTNLQDFNFWLNTYGGTSPGSGRMGTALTEAMQRPFYTTGAFTPQYGALDYLASVGRGRAKAQEKTDKAWFQARRRVGRYNVGLGRRVDLKYALARLNSEFDGWNLGFRYEDNRKMTYDEQRHVHQAEILNLGISAGNAARAGLATSVKALSEARSQEAGQFGSISNGLSTFAGYMQQTQNMKRRSVSISQNIARGGIDLAAPKPQSDSIFSGSFGR